MIFNKQNSGDNELATLASWTAGHKFQHLEESLIQATSWLTSILGSETVDAIDSYYWGAYTFPETDLEKTHRAAAIVLAQRALLNYAYKLQTPKAQVHFDNSGVSIKWSDSYRPAKAELPAFLSSLENSAFFFVNELIKYMESRPELYEHWIQGVAKKKADELLIRSAYEFNERYQIQNSFAFFYATLDKQSRVQREYVKPVVGDFWSDMVKMSSNPDKFKEFGTSDTFENLPPETEFLMYLVTSESAFYQYTDEWNKYCLDLRDDLDIAKQIIAEGTIYLKSLSDIKEISKQAIDTNQPNEAQLKMLAAMSAHQKTITEALVKQLSDAVAKRRFTPAEAEEVFTPDAAPYQFLSSNNSFML